MTACKPVPPVPPDMLPLQEEPCSEAEMVTPGRASERCSANWTPGGWQSMA